MFCFVQKERSSWRSHGTSILIGSQMLSNFIKIHQTLQKFVAVENFENLWDKCARLPFNLFYTIKFYHFVLSTYPIGSLIISASKCVCVWKRVFTIFTLQFQCISIYLQCSIFGLVQKFKNKTENFYFWYWVTQDHQISNGKGTVWYYYDINRSSSNTWMKYWSTRAITLYCTEYSVGGGGTASSYTHTHTEHIHVERKWKPTLVFITQTRVCKPHHTQNTRRKRNEMKYKE